MSNPIINAEINENIPTIGVNVPDGNVPVLPIESLGDTPTPVEPVIESISITENGTYNVPEGVDGFNPVTVNVSGSQVYTPTYIKLQKYFREPEIGHLPDASEDTRLIYTNWVYLESAGDTIVPPYPNDNLSSKVVVSDVQNPNFTTITGATKFYLFSSDVNPHARGSYPNELTYTQSHNQQVAPTKIYSYTPGGTFEWTEITIDISTWDNKGYNNYIDRVLYSSVDIVRNTVSSIVYYMLSNLIGETGKISDPYKTDYYDVYYCVDGTKTNTLGAVTEYADVRYIGNMTLKGMYDLLSGGSFPPTI